ncbi:flagellar hook-length control protein FliK [Cytobacillus firmus]|uniref:Flagellar hook-length control protein FliK n=2 Tax=Cytobacillus TaxID=2675230 RepID=A0A366K0F5_CYTFI|nr:MULTISPECIES: flagellar hook-length control protein FliK [Cytobacillus]RBP95249.1 flagellar hook-length control protein FliK [Cytobacillus firmus]TDX44090.1 flagellar hook-length control protein FliK [Cytobacillus oceanisediminis]
MQIGRLGFIQAQYSSEDKISLQDTSSTGFGSLFFALTGTAKPQAESLPAAADAEKVEQLKELMEFLKVGEITELENGSELLEKISFQTDTDIIEVISEQLNLTQEELVQMLEGFMDQVLPGVKLEDVYSMEDLEDGNKIQLLISAISNFDVKEGMILQGKDFSGALKALKLYDILSAKKDFLSSKMNVKEFLNHVQIKVEGLINSTSVDKGSIIQKVFTPLANELNTAKQQNNSANENLGQAAFKIINRPETALQGFVQVQSFSKPEQMALLNPQGRTVSPDQLMQQFENILSKSSFLKTGGTQKLFIKLNPDHLGALRIELIQKDSAMIARILTSTGSAKEILDSHINGLKQAFSSQNIQIERIEISQQMTQQDRSFNRDPQQQEQRQQQNKDENNMQPESEFNSSFEEALLNTEA